MRLRFRTVFRGYVVVLTALLFWAIWASAQDSRSTNAAPESTASTNRVSSAGTNSSPANATASNLPGNKQKDPLLTFGLHRVPWLQREVPTGIPLWQYAASLIYILLAFYVSKLFDLITRVYLKRWAAGTRTTIDDLVLAALDVPIKVISFAVLLYIGLEVFAWPEFVNNIFKKALTIVVALSLTYLLTRLVDVMMGYWKARAAAETDKSFNDQLFAVLRKSFKAFIVVVAVLVTSQNLGVNITGLIASLSIGGLALGLAAQDTVANLFGAVAVFVDKPFRIGDRIKLDAIDGTVESIGLRSTRVRNLDGHLITIPNKTMGNATVTNITQRPNIKTVMNIGITYDTPAEKVRLALKILQEVYRSHPMTHDLVLSFNQFAESSLNILVVHWWNSTDHKAYLAGMQEMNLSIKERFDAAKISFAFPSRTLYVKQDSDWKFQLPPTEPRSDSASASKSAT